MVKRNKRRSTLPYEYIEESIKWLKEINVDQPCPSKNHLFKAN